MLTEFFYIENKQSYNYLKNMRSFCAILYNVTLRSVRVTTVAVERQ